MDGQTGTVTTPASTGTASTAAVATPATATATPSTTTTSERPRTFQEAFARDAAQPQTETQAPTETAATEQAESTDATSATTENTNTPDKPQGPIPFEVHKKTLNNAYTERDTARAQVSQLETHVSQLMGVPREELAQVAQVARSMNADPVGHTFGMLKELLGDANHGQIVRSELARMFSGLRNTAQQQAVDLSPDLIVDDGQGRQISTFSADRVQQIVQHAIADAMQKEVGPIKQTYEQQQKAQKAAEANRVLEAKADEVLADITAIVGEDDEAISAVATTMEKNPSWSAQRAAAHVHKTVLLPKLQGQAQSKVLDDLKTKAAASTVNPAAAGVASTKRVTSFHDKSLTWR